MMSEHDIRRIQNNLSMFMSGFDAPADEVFYSDAYIEFWAREFRSRRVWRYDIPFELFLRQPRRTLDALMYGGFLPLLPEQCRVQLHLDGEALDETEALAGCDRPGPNVTQRPALHGPRYVQPMRPRAWLANWKTGRKAGGAA